MEDRRGSQRRQETPAFVDRRKKDDWVTNMATIFSLVSWVVAFGVWVVLDMAAPEKENMFTRMFSLEVRSHWDASLLPIALTLLIVSFCICIVAFVFNMLRKKRKTDKFKKSIFLIGIATIVGIVFFLMRFGDLLV